MRRRNLPLLIATFVTALAWPVALRAQAHDHAVATPARNAQLDLLLGGPHLILHHRGYLALSDAQVIGLQRLRRAVCEAEETYVDRTAEWRGQLPDLLDDSAQLPQGRSSTTARAPQLMDVMSGLAAAEAAWLVELMRTRRDALALLSAAQRAEVEALRDHWVRETVAMIEEATRPGQRGHPGMQIPIRVPGMVVGATKLLPYCEALHGPSMHLSVPPPR